MPAPLPMDEAERLDVLHALDILDTAPEDIYDDITRLAAHLCGAQVAAVTLVDSQRVWFKSILGLDANETSRQDAFCSHTILQPEVLVIQDAQADSRFADNPFVTGDPSIRFYAGMPLVTSDGHALGSLCVLDRVPRRLTPEQEEALRVLARQVTAQLELARRLAQTQSLIADKECLTAERQRADAERLRLAAIVENSEDAIYSLALDGTITSWNMGAERLYGYAEEEVIGRHIDALVPSERRDELVPLIEAIGRGERVAALETVRLTRAGERVDVSLRISVVTDAGGGVVGASLIARDISERKRAEAALAAEREFQWAMLESLQEGIVACDAMGTLTLFNRATREFHGLPEQPLPPEQWAEHFDLYHADGLTPMATDDIPLFRALQGETVRGTEMVIAPGGDAPRRTLLASGQAIYGPDGTKLGAVVAMHDVTERRQAECENARLAAIVESAEEAILAATLDGTITAWNSGAERLYGYTAAEIIGQHASILAQPHEKGLIRGVIERMTRGEAVQSMEVVRDRRDGTTVDVSLSFSPIRATTGQTIGVSCIGRDITARKRAEAALIESSARLQESETRLRRLTDAAFEGIAFSQNGVLVDVSRAYAAQFGYDDPAEMSSLPVSAISTPESRALVLGKIAAGDEEPYEAILQRRDGTTFHAEIQGRQTQIDGRPVRVTAVRDITERKRLEEGLRESAERLRRNEAALRAVLESAPIILYAVDAQGVVTLSEGTGLAALGLAPGEAVGHSVFSHSGSAENEAHTRRALAGESASYDARVNGLWLHTELRPVQGGDGSPAGFIGVCFDVTERVASEERFRALFEQSSHAHLLFDEVGGIIDCNAAALAMMRCTDKAHLLGVHPARLSPEFQPDGRRSDEKGAEMCALAWRNGGHRFEWQRRALDGYEYPMEVAITPLTLGGRPVLLSVWHDLTERKQQEERIRDHAVVLEFKMAELEEANAKLAALATTDGLTGLKNHRAFQERLAQEVSRAVRYGQPLSVVLLDVDHFKAYNDAFGHPAGDEVLRQVARALQVSARETDLVARYGGEEFALILPETDSAGAVVIAERIRHTIQTTPWPERNITASFGVAAVRAGVEGGGLIARADRFLYEAKATGRNRVCV